VEDRGEVVKVVVAERPDAQMQVDLGRDPNADRGTGRIGQRELLNRAGLRLSGYRPIGDRCSHRPQGSRDATRPTRKILRMGLVEQE
jgi:hypothetical protein